MLSPLLTLALFAAAPEPLSLERLLSDVAAAPQIRARQEAVQAARSGVRVAGAWEDPTLGVMAEDVPLPGMSAMEDPMRPMLTYRVMQPLNVFGRRELAKQGAEARVGVARAGLRRVEWDARSQAVSGFYELWMNLQMGKVLERQVVTVRQMREAALARYSAGLMMGHHEVLRAESALAGMQAELASLEEERAAILAMLNLLRNRPQDEPLGEPVLPRREPLPEVQALLARGEERPEVASMRSMRGEMEAQLGLARRMYLPMVMAEAFYQQRLGPTPDSFGGAINFTLPLWWFDRQKNEVAMAEAMTRRTERELEAMRAMTSSELRAAYARARAAERNLEALESTALPRLRETVKSASSAYVSGSGDFLALLEATMALRNMEAQRLQAVVRREVARFELARLLGAPLTETSAR